MFPRCSREGLVVRRAGWQLLVIFTLGVVLMVCAWPKKAKADQLVLSFGPTLNGNTNPKMAGVGYELFGKYNSLLIECRGIFASELNGACGLTLSARVATPSGMFVRVGAGPSWYFRKDDRVSSNLNANIQGAVGLFQDGWAIGLLYVHYSNAGTVPPNLGRDFIGPVVEFPL